jgi:hypothetical protein
MATTTSTTTATTSGATKDSADSLSQMNLNRLAVNLNVGEAAVLIFSTALSFLVAGLWRDFLEDAMDMCIPRTNPRRSKSIQLAFNFALSLAVTIGSVFLIFLLFHFAAANTNFWRKQK